MIGFDTLSSELVDALLAPVTERAQKIIDKQLYIAPALLPNRPYVDAVSIDDEKRDAVGAWVECRTSV